MFPSLEELHIDGNGLRDFDVGAAGLSGGGGGALKNMSLAHNRFETLGQVAAALGPQLLAQLTTVNVSNCPIADITAIDRFPVMEKLVMRDVHLASWDDLLPVHDAAPQLRHLCFSSPHLDGLLDTGDDRRRQVVGLLPKHVTHLNLSNIRESEWRTARQVIMTDYVRRMDAGEIAPEAVPVVVQRLIKEQTSEGVRVFVPKPRYLELDITVTAYVLVADRAGIHHHEEKHFLLLTQHHNASSAEQRNDAKATLVAPKSDAETHEGFVTVPDFAFDIRKTVGDLRSMVHTTLAGDASPTAALTVAEWRFQLETLASHAGLSLAEFRAGVNVGVLRLFHLDAELMQNSGAVARGFHCKELTPDRPPLHNWRFQTGDGLVIAVMLPRAGCS